MNKRWIKMLVLILIWGTIAIAGFGSAIWQLWNWLMPELFGLPAIGFWQAVGLMALCWLLFGGWRGAGRLGGPRHHDQRSLSAEEKEKIRASMGRHCG